MQLGVTLPTFTADPEEPLEAARAAEAAGLHGVFSFDHLWPLGHPERPSLSVYPTLGAVGSVTRRVRVGTLVARVGLLPDEVVAAGIEGLQAMVGARLVAGLGTGDEQSAPEHFRYGLPYLGRRARVASLEALASRFVSSGIECWIGGGSLEVDAVARASGAALNLWGVSAERLREVRARLRATVTWAGPLPKTAQAAAGMLSGLDAAGAEWVVWGWPDSLDLVVESAGLAGIGLN